MTARITGRCAIDYYANVSLTLAARRKSAIGKMEAQRGVLKGVLESFPESFELPSEWEEYRSHADFLYYLLETDRPNGESRRALCEWVDSSTETIDAWTTKPESIPEACKFLVIVKIFYDLPKEVKAHGLRKVVFWPQGGSTADDHEKLAELKAKGALVEENSEELVIPAWLRNASAGLAKHLNRKVRVSYLPGEDSLLLGYESTEDIERPIRYLENVIARVLSEHAKD